MTSNFKKVIGTATLGLAMLITVGSSSTAQAQYPQYPQQYPNQNDRYRRDRDRDWNRNQDRDQDWRRGRGDRGRGRSWDQYPNWGGSFQLRQTALNAGYNEGIKQGRDDLRHHRRSDFQRNGAFRNATKDYNSRDGDRELYRRYYREAFQNGYQAGYNGY